MIVLGIDPGSQRTGWGVVEQSGSRLHLIALGVLSPPNGQALESRLAHLHAGVRQVLQEHAPGIVGMETVFHGPNTRSLVTLGQARGAIMATIGAAAVPLVELAPAEVKRAVTGRGGATKEQVSHMVAVLLGPQATSRADALGARGRLDATDALAVAIATVHRRTRNALARET